MENEHVLIRQILLGESELFEHIVLHYQNLVFTVCFNIVQNEHDAENMAQEAFLTAYCSLANYHGGNFKSWLCKIAANKSIDFKRRSTKLNYEDYTLYEQRAQSEDDIEELLVQNERQEKLRELLSAIPEKYSTVIEAFYYQQLPVKEIARRMGLPQKTVETRLYRGKKILKERWGGDET
jgi:RNA polymerase sigma factor (sigma-70 family)